MVARVIDLKILAESAAARAQLDAIIAKAEAIKKLDPTLTVRVDRTALTQGLAVLNAETRRAVKGINDQNAAVTTATALWTAGAGRLGFLTGKVQLFGGALTQIGVPAMLATAGGLHLIIDAAVETAAVVGPAAVALAAFGIAAVPNIQAVTAQMKAMNTVATALGVTIPGLSGAFQKAADAVKPQVYQLFGDALVIAAQKGGVFVTLAHSAGAVVDQLAARFVAATTAGSGFGAFLHNAAPDLAKIGELTGNLFGAIGNVLKVLPGYAQVLLNVAVGFSRILETATRVAAPVIGFGLAAHGALVYAGLLGTAVTFLATRGLPLIAGIATNAALGLGKLGLGSSLAARGLAGVAAGATTAAALPWGWIGIAAAAFGVLAFSLLTAKDSTQQYVSSLENLIQQAPLMSLQTTIMSAQAGVASDLAGAHRSLAAAMHITRSELVAGAHGWQVNNTNLFTATARVDELTAAQQQLSAQDALVNSRVAELSRTYGGNKAALGLLNAAGITSSQLLDTNKAHWAAVQVQVDATRRAYAEMGQQSGIFGSDMNVINALASTQYTDMQQLNSAWDTYLNNMLKMESSSNAAITAFGTLTKDAKALGASFTGVNAASITLQNDFLQNLFPSVQQVIDGMRAAGAPVRALASYMSTLLTPAVKAGALANYGMRTAIYDMAQQAGYTGPNKIGPLSAWINANKTSLQNAATEAQTYSGKLGNLAQQAGNAAGALPGLNRQIIGSGAAALGAAGNINSYATAINNVPTSHTTTMYTNFVNIGTPPTTGGILPTPTGHAAGTMSAPPGWSWVGERGPELLRFRGGEQVLPSGRSLALSGAGPGTGAVNVTLTVGGTARNEADAFLVSWLKRLIASGHLDVQMAP